jgi:hypothetical protein
VDEVIGDLDFAAGTHEARRVGDVAAVKLQSRRLQPTGARRVADQAARQLALAGQRLGQAGADEAGGTRYERFGGDGNKLPGNGRL